MPFTLLFLLAILMPLRAAEPAKVVSLDFVDTPIAEVVRSVSLAYDTPVLVDDNLDFKVTFHLDGVGVLEALTELCSANGLELVQQESGDTGSRPGYAHFSHPVRYLRYPVPLLARQSCRTPDRRVLL